MSMPGTSRFSTTGTLPMASIQPRSFFIVASAVFGPRVTSTTIITWAGTLKCSPALRACFFSGFTTSRTRNPEVLVQISVSARTRGSMSRSSSCFRARSSNTASMTRSISFQGTASRSACRRMRFSTEAARRRLPSLAQQAAARFLIAALVSTTSQRHPARANAMAMSAPMRPAPMMVTQRALLFLLFNFCTGGPHDFVPGGDLGSDIGAEFLRRAAHRHGTELVEPVLDLSRL